MTTRECRLRLGGPACGQARASEQTARSIPDRGRQLIFCRHRKSRHASLERALLISIDEGEAFEDDQPWLPAIGRLDARNTARLPEPFPVAPHGLLNEHRRGALRGRPGS